MSLFSGEARLAQPDKPSDCILLLGSHLEDALSENSAMKRLTYGPIYSCLLTYPPLYGFPVSFLDILLNIASVHTAKLGLLVQFVRQHADSITWFLETTSLRGLAYFFLASDTQDSKECGLYLLLNSTKHVVDSGPMGFQSDSLESDNRWQLVGKKLIPTVRQLFTCVHLDIGTRRMAGKALVEMIQESDGSCNLLVQGDKNHFLGFLTVNLYGSDPIMSFFAFALAQALYLSGIELGQSLTQEGTELTIFNYMKSYQRNVLYQFFYYIRSRIQRPPNPLTTLPNTIGSPPLSYLLRIPDGANTDVFLRGPVLLIFHGEILNFIQCSPHQTGRHVDYATICVNSRYHLQYAISSHHEGQGYLLTFNTGAESLVLVNDHVRNLGCLKFILRSNYDLMGIQRRLEETGVQCLTQHVSSALNAQRSSSIMIPMDAAEEIAEKSCHPSQNARQADIKSTDRAELGNELSNISGQSGGNSSQSPLTELTQTPTVYGYFSPEEHHDNPRRIRTEDPNRKEISEGEKTVCHGGVSNITRNKDTTSSCQHDESLSFQSQRECTDDFESRDHQSRNAIPTAMELKSAMPDTQESLIFPRKHLRGKLYTAPSKTIINQDKGFQPSDGTVEHEDTSEAELTSISPPPHGVSPSCTQLSAGNHEYASDKNRAVETAKRQPKRRKEKLRRSANRGVKVSLQTRANLTNEISRKGLYASKPGKTQTHRTSFSDVANACNAPELTDNITGATSDVSQLQKQDDPSSLAGAKNTGDDRINNIITHLKMGAENAADDNINIGSFMKDQYFDWNPRGRGQTVAEKLRAALRQSVSISPKNQNSENHAKYLGGDENGFGRDVEYPGLQDALAHNTPRSNDKLQKDYDIQAIPGYSVLHMSQQDAIIEKPCLSLAHNRSESYFLNGTENMRSGSASVKRPISSEPHDGRDGNEMQMVPSRAASSSVEPQSEGSVSESARRSPSLVPTIPDPTWIESLDQSSSDSASYWAEEEFDGMSSTYDTELATVIFPEAAIQGHSGHVINSLDSIYRTIVDNNGSPRLLHQPKGHTTPKRRGSTIGEQMVSVKRRRISKEVYDADMDFAGQAKENTSQRFTRVSGDSNRISSVFQTCDNFGDKPAPFLARLRAHTGETDHLQGPKSPRSGSSRAINNMQGVRQATEDNFAHVSELQPPLSRLPPDQPDSELLHGDKASEEALNQIDWQTPLQQFHQRWQTLLDNTNEQLSRQIEVEGRTFQKVLDTYREHCGQMFVHLHEVQKRRIKLCEEQIQIIRDQHAHVYRQLIRGVEDDKRRLDGIYGSQ